LAKERLGNALPQELAAYIEETFGLTIKPPIVTVLLGSLLERAALDRSALEAREKIERWKTENPLEAKKIDAAAKRKEAARRKKAGIASDQGAESSAATRPAEQHVEQPVEVAVDSKGGGASAELPGLTLRWRCYLMGQHWQGLERAGGKSRQSCLPSS
jgi:hypothetical protein